MNIKMFLALLTSTFLLSHMDVAAMSKEQAMQRCQERFEKLNPQSSNLPDNHNKASFFDASRHVEGLLQKLKASTNPSEIYEISSQCHSAMRTMEWFITTYAQKSGVTATSVIDVPSLKSTAVQKALIEPDSASAPKKTITPVSLKKTKPSKAIPKTPLDVRKRSKGAKKHSQKRV